MAKPDYEMYARAAKLRAEGLNTKEIGKAIDRTPQAVLNIEMRAGVPKRKPGFPPSPIIAARNEAIYDALMGGNSIQAVAENLGLSTRMIRVIKHKVAIKRRSHAK